MGGGCTRRPVPLSPARPIRGRAVAPRQLLPQQLDRARHGRCKRMQRIHGALRRLARLEDGKRCASGGCPHLHLSCSRILLWLHCYRLWIWYRIKKIAVRPIQRAACPRSLRGHKGMPNCTARQRPRPPIAAPSAPIAGTTNATVCLDNTSTADTRNVHLLRIPLHNFVESYRNWESMEKGATCVKSCDSSERSFSAFSHWSVMHFARPARTPPQLTPMAAVHAEAWPKGVRSALCIIPPVACWPQIQAIRKAHDRVVQRWMPHINVYADLHRQRTRMMWPLSHAAQPVSICARCPLWGCRRSSAGGADGRGTLHSATGALSSF